MSNLISQPQATASNKNAHSSNITHLTDDNSRSSQDSDTSKPKAWEKPGVWGTTRRTWRSIQRYIWDDPDKSQKEKKFLLKLDLFLLSYTCLGYFCKNLDQANISNAYVSGMKESLGMNKSELTYMSNIFTAGYVVGQLPAVILVTKIRPSYLVSSLEILWAIFTFCCASVSTVPQLYALRFLIGLCEGAFFPVIIYLIGSWCKCSSIALPVLSLTLIDTKSERAKRVTIFYSTATMSGMFSGYLQAAAYDNLDGHLGRQGWQWLFIICGIISLPVGVIGYFFNPDFPENTRAFYLKPAEAEYARQRLLDNGYQPLGAAKWDKTKIFRIAKTWQFWVLPIGYFFVQSSLPSQQPVYALWLKSTNHTIYQINVWPSATLGIGVIVQIVAGMLSDSPLLRGNRWQAITLMQTGTLFSAIVLAIWNVPSKLKFAAFNILYMSAGVPGIYYSWFPDLIPHDHEMRGFLIAFSNMFSYINQIWFADAVWRTIEAPKFTSGFIAASVFGVCMIATSILLSYLEKRDSRGREVERIGHREDIESPGASVISEGKSVKKI
jgi:ACS family pantothenate transporter-like MFS transporter